MDEQSKWHTWILSDHYDPIPGPRGRGRTYLGELVYRAKYCDDRQKLNELRFVIRHCVRQLSQFPPRTDALAGVTAVAAVPCYPPKALSLPHEIAQEAAMALGVRDISSQLTKTRSTPSSKTNPLLQPDAYAVEVRLDGAHVLLVDDLYRTGSTLESVAIQLRAAGAERVVGLCVTKAHKGMN